MFENYNAVKKEMDKELYMYLENLFEKHKYKYFYNTSEEIKKLSKLKLNYIFFDKKQKNKIEEFEIYIGSEKVGIKIKDTSIRGEFNIEQINKITKIKREQQYIKEFLLYYVLKKLETENVELQKENFLYIYLEEYVKNIEFKKYQDDNYIRAIKQIKYYQDLQKELKENKKNSNLVNKNLVNNLYIKKEYKDNLIIIFYIETMKNFNNILEKLEEICSNKRLKYFYRGQNNSEWFPCASVAREKGYLTNEHLMFYKLISKMPKAFEKDKYIYNKIATMQHFGYPTRLIDITENPLVALYFACEGNEEQDGEIIVYEVSEDEILNFEDEKLRCLERISINKAEDICKNCEKENSCDKNEILGKSYIVQGMAQNERISSQSGNFIFVGIGEKNKYCEKLNQIPLKHIIIDKKLKKEILSTLESLNINGGTIYPDLMNLAKYLKEKYKMSEGQ